METIYIAAGHRGLLKVGRTKDAKRRVHGLRKEFQRKGDEMCLFEACPPTTNGFSAEFQLISMFKARFERHSGREWFIHAGALDEAIRSAHEVSEHVRMTHKEPAEITPEERARWKKLEADQAAKRRKRSEEARRRSEQAEARRTTRQRIAEFRATVCARIAETLVSGASAA